MALATGSATSEERWQFSTHPRISCASERVPSHHRTHFAFLPVMKVYSGESGEECTAKTI
jgi:hypothetical protein